VHCRRGRTLAGMQQCHACCKRACLRVPTPPLHPKNMCKSACMLYTRCASVEGAKQMHLRMDMHLPLWKGQKATKTCHWTSLDTCVSTLTPE
jgi:hypothetical protein